MDLETASRQLEALGNPAWLRTYCALLRAGNGPVCHAEYHTMAGLPGFIAGEGAA